MYDGQWCMTPDQPRCSLTTFLYRVAFTVWHASFFIERVRDIHLLDFHFSFLNVIPSANYLSVYIRIWPMIGNDLLTTLKIFSPRHRKVSSR